MLGAATVGLGFGMVLIAASGVASQAQGEVQGYGPLWSLTQINPRFWAAWATGLIAALVSSWVWVVKPDDRSVRLYALSGLATLTFCMASAGLWLPTPPTAALTSGLVVLNVAAACAFGLIMIVLSATYPKPLPGTRWIVFASIALFGAWTIWMMRQPQALFIEVHRITLAEMAAILTLSGAQVLAARKDPVRFAIAVWLGACVLLGAGGFIATVALPSAFGAPPLIANEYAFCFFLVIYAGLAVGLLRYRVFGLGRWAFQVLFTVGAAFALLLIDAILILVLPLDRQTTIALSLFAAALLYLPLRGWLWSRLVRQRRWDQSALVRAMIDIGLQPTRERRAALWQALVRTLFSPLHVAQQNGEVREASVQEEGRVLVSPSMAGFPSLVLRDRDQGRTLFSPGDAAAVTDLLALVLYLDESHAAHERGAAEERARIARDIHDNIGAQLLSALHVREGSRKDELIRDAIGEVRSVINNAAGEQELFEDVAADLRAETAERLEARGLNLAWRVESAGADAPRPAAMYALRALVREAVSNVLRHGAATTVDVELVAQGRMLHLQIADDGAGCDRRQEPRQGHGLANMQQRVAALGGTISIDLESGGARIRAAFPAFGPG